jgi:hypothetical protein
VRYFPPKLKLPPLRIASFTYHEKTCSLDWVRRRDGSDLFVLTCPVCSRRLSLDLQKQAAIISFSKAGALVRTLSRVECPAPCSWAIVISLGVVYDVARDGNGRDKEKARDWTAPFPVQDVERVTASADARPEQPAGGPVPVPRALGTPRPTARAARRLGDRSPDRRPPLS